MRGIATMWALVMALVACVPGVAAAAPDPPDPGKTTSGTVKSNGTDYGYLLYTPRSYVARRAAPLVVAVHGCQTTALQHMKSTLFNKVAEREGFVVLYPDVDALGRTQPGPANQCWKFPYPPAWTRGNSDAAAIADMTRSVMAKRTIDAERVYIAGTSAGGLMAAIEAAAYPDLFAATSIVASAGYADWPCFTTGVGIPVTTSAQLAYEQMGPRARVVPRIAIGSDGDLAFPAACSDKALEQSLRTSNLVLSRTQEKPLALTPATVREQRKRGGLGYTVSNYHDPSGCLVGERWIIHGMPHAWPGGTTDPKYAGFTDARAPSGAEGTWAFFKRYRRSDTAMPCAETPRRYASATCPGRRVKIKLARGARVRGVRAWVAGRRVRTKRRGRRVTLRLPAGPRGKVRVRLRVRRQGRKHARTLRRKFARCRPHRSG